MNHCLPVTLPPLPGELLSSWISRHAEFYCVTPLTMLRHCLPESASLRAIDLMLSIDQANTSRSPTRQNTQYCRSISVPHSSQAWQSSNAQDPQC
ncbi:TniQ family protein [Celeribacter baekdonensis]|uniref:TniQ family protein n=1 Tax=Celeribacter baekdonensis TaxID=875171 RepID=UPI0020C8232A|nr:TniQ family protein [Celeribacter baekdonensis]